MDRLRLPVVLPLVARAHFRPLPSRPVGLISQINPHHLNPSLTSTSARNNSSAHHCHWQKLDQFKRNLSNRAKSRQVNMVSPKLPPSPPKRGTICVEGNIGCGKTTFLEFFKNNFQTAGEPDPGVIAEPVEKWRNVEGENLFQYLYKDPARYSLAFQTYVQLTMMKLHKKQPRLMERSIYSARYCFVENLYQLNYLSRLEYVILDKWFKHLVLNGSDEDDSTVNGHTNIKEIEYNKLSSPTGVDLDMIIYLRCTPQKVMDRIKVRSRAEEKDISLNYVQSLHDLHEDWLVSRKFPVPAPVLILDTNCRQSSLVKLYEQAAPYICGDKKLSKSPTLITLENEALLCGY